MIPLYILYISIRNDSGYHRLARDRSKFHFNSLNLISFNSYLKAGSNYMRANFPRFINSMILMIQQSLSVNVKLLYENKIQRSPGNNVVTAWQKV